MPAFAAIQVDADVAQRLMRGERAAQETVYRAYADAVHTLARRVLGDSGLAEEATQDTFVQVIERAGKLRDANALSPWIRSIAVNQCLMRLRSPWQQRREPLAEDERASPENAGAALDMERALGRLSAQARLVVWMHCVEGYTHREIGQALGRTASFSKSQLARACRTLAEHRGQLPQPDQPAAAGQCHERTATPIVCVS